MENDGDPSGRQLQLDKDKEELKPSGVSESGVNFEKEEKTDTTMVGSEDKGEREDAPPREKEQGEWQQVNRKKKKKRERKGKQEKKGSRRLSSSAAKTRTKTSIPFSCKRRFQHWTCTHKTRS